jgi:hypothetical protein
MSVLGAQLCSSLILGVQYPKAVIASRTTQEPMFLCQIYERHT